jgi:hypothetical protein
MSGEAPPPAAAPPPRPWRRRAGIAALALIYVALPVALAFVPRWLLTLCIISGGGVGLARLLTDPRFDRRRLFDAAAARRGLPRILARTAVVWAGLFALVWLARPGMLFLFPRTRPGLWLAIMVGYSVLSAYPQEILYRTFVFHWAPPALARTPLARIALSAALFGWGHVALRNVPAVVLSTAGGFLFASTYERSRSTLLAAIEHALYGCFIFTVGLGDLFYNPHHGPPPPLIHP